MFHLFLISELDGGKLLHNRRGKEPLKTGLDGPPGRPALRTRGKAAGGAIRGVARDATTAS